MQDDGCVTDDIRFGLSPATETDVFVVNGGSHVDDDDSWRGL